MVPMNVAFVVGGCIPDDGTTVVVDLDHVGDIEYLDAFIHDLAYDIGKRDGNPVKNRHYKVLMPNRTDHPLISKFVTADYLEGEPTGYGWLDVDSLLSCVHHDPSGGYGDAYSVESKCVYMDNIGTWDSDHYDSILVGTFPSARQFVRELLFSDYRISDLDPLIQKHINYERMANELLSSSYFGGKISGGRIVVFRNL